MVSSSSLPAPILTVTQPAQSVRKNSLIVQQVIPEHDPIERFAVADPRGVKQMPERLTNNEQQPQRLSVTSIVSETDSVFRKSDPNENDLAASSNRPWWFSICLKCHRPNEGPAWEPSYWSRTCPYPLCPTYRKFARIAAIFLIGSLVWSTLYIIAGRIVAPGGHLFDIAVLSIAAFLGGWIFSLTALPSLIGMLITGMLLQNANLIDINDDFDVIVSWFRKIALAIILVRAGLEMDPVLFAKIKTTVLRLSLIPWLVEFAVMGLGGRFLLRLPWLWSAMLAAIIAAISPAVIVPGLLRLRDKGYGTAKGIPTLIIAVSGIDDAVSVAVYGIIKTFVPFDNERPDQSSASDWLLLWQLGHGPVSIAAGIVLGYAYGKFLRFVPEQHDPFQVPLRIILLLFGGVVFVIGSEHLDYAGSGPLAVITAAFTASSSWTRTAIAPASWNYEDNPVATTFEILWLILEPVLFAVTGAQIKLAQLDPSVLLRGVLCLTAAVSIRIAITILASVGCQLNTKEKIFVSFAWMSKATVQAALGPIAYFMIGDSSPNKQYARIILMICVLSIMVTAPLGAISISVLGPKLLKKTKNPTRNSTSAGTETGPRHRYRLKRPSIRDISLNDDDDVIVVDNGNNGIINIISPSPSPSTISVHVTAATSSDRIVA